MTQAHAKETALSSADARLPFQHIFYKITTPATAVGLICLLVAVYLATKSPTAFFFSFHVSWLFFTSLAFGAVFFVLIQFASRAGWCVVIRRLAENVALTMPLFFALLIVMAFGTKFLYHHWLSPESFSDKILQAKRWYLNIPFFYIRAVLYFIAFSFAALFFAHHSAKQDDSGNHHITYKLQKASIPFLIVLGFFVTFAAIDWIMSLEPHWYSTIFGLYFFAGCYVAFVSLLTILTYITQKIPTLRTVVNTEHYHDLGKLIFGHSCFWAYAGFAQYLLIWYGNIPEETLWYAVRQSNGWWGIWALLCVGHFVVPFLFLLARRAKRSRCMVVVVAVWVLVMHFIDIFWLVMPAHYTTGPIFGLVDLFCLLGIGGLFVGLFSAITRRKLLVPVQDPRLHESMTYENV